MRVWVTQKEEKELEATCFIERISMKQGWMSWALSLEGL
jgi:hypothetical protein